MQSGGPPAKAVSSVTVGASLAVRRRDSKRNETNPRVRIDGPETRGTVRPAAAPSVSAQRGNSFAKRPILRPRHLFQIQALH